MGEETTADVQIRNINKRTIAALIGILIVGGAVPVANMVADRDTADRFYGYEGRRLQRSDATQTEQLTSHAARLKAIEKEVTDIRHDDETCIERQMRLEADVGEMQELHGGLHDKVYEFQARKNAVDSHQSQLIDMCMGRVQ